MEWKRDRNRTVVPADDSDDDNSEYYSKEREPDEPKPPEESWAEEVAPHLNFRHPIFPPMANWI